MRDQLFAARPEPGLAAAADELRADAVPLPLDQPVGAIAERRRAGLRAATRGRTDRAATDRPPPVSAATTAANHSADGVQSPISRAATIGRLDAGRVGQRADDQRLRHADAELAGQQLVEEEALGARQRRATSRSPSSRCVAGSAFCSGRSRSSTHVGERQIRLGRAGRHRVERERDELGEVAGRRVALAQQPVGQPVTSCAHCAQPGRRHDALQAAAGEKEDRPRRVGGRRVAEVRRQRRDLRVGRRRPIDRVVERRRSASHDSRCEARGESVSEFCRRASASLAAPLTASRLHRIRQLPSARRSRLRTRCG